MRVAYVNLIMSSSSGIANKLEKQASAAKKEKLNFDFYWITGPTGPTESDYENISIIRFDTTNPFVLRWKQCKEVNRLLLEYDRVLLRYPLFDPISMLTLRHRDRIILEHHTKEVPELKLIGDFRWITELVFGGFWIRGFCALTAVTPEILNYERNRSGFRKAVEIFTNSVNIDEYAFVNNEICKEGGLIRAIMVASTFNEWHGLSKVLEDFQEGNTNKLMELHIVGRVDGQWESALKKIKGVIYHGVLSPENLVKLYGSMDVGIGSMNMGLFLSQGATLKVREYLAVGLPVVIGHADPAFPDGFPYVLNVRMFKVKDVCEYLSSLQGVDKSTVREASRPYIDSRKLIQKQFNFCVSE